MKPKWMTLEWRPPAKDAKEFRLIEIIGVVVLTLLKPFLLGRLRKYRPIAAKTVAKVMVEISKQHKSGNHLFLNDDIQAAYDKLPKG